MTNLEAKQEAIKKAYGEYYIHSDINGWMRFGMYCPTDLGIENYDKMNGFWRCKSLQGIENNNGWIKIESEADLPKENTWCFIISNNIGLTHGNFLIKDKDFWLNDATHYQPIEFPKLPIF